MPFVDDTHPLFAWRGGGDASMSYMWQLSFPVPLQQSLALAGDKARLKALALQVHLCEIELSSRFEVFAAVVRRLARAHSTFDPDH